MLFFLELAPRKDIVAVGSFKTSFGEEPTGIKVLDKCSGKL